VDLSGHDLSDGLQRPTRSPWTSWLGLLVLFLDSTDTQREEDMFVLPRHFYVKVKPHVLNTTLAVIKHCMMIGY